MQKNSRIALAMFLLLACIVQPAKAEIFWNWRIDNPTPTVATGEVLTVHGTLYNDASSTENIESLLVDLPYPYPRLFGPISTLIGNEALAIVIDYGPVGPETFASQFSGISIAPGEAFSFDLYSLVNPYNVSPLHIFAHHLALYPWEQSQLGDGVTITVVPEPSVTVLMVLGVLPIILARIGLRSRPNFGIHPTCNGALRPPLQMVNSLSKCTTKSVLKHFVRCSVAETAAGSMVEQRDDECKLLVADFVEVSALWKALGQTGSGLAPRHRCVGARLTPVGARGAPCIAP